MQKVNLTDDDSQAALACLQAEIDVVAMEECQSLIDGEPFEGWGREGEEEAIDDVDIGVRHAEVL